MYIFSDDLELSMDDKSAVKAKGLWEDWHMRQAVDQAARVNHRSGMRGKKCKAVVPRCQTRFLISFCKNSGSICYYLELLK